MPDVSRAPAVATALAPDWQVRPYRAGDERALVELWAEAFGRPMTQEFWRWKAKGRPSPVENVGIAVDAGDRPIAQFLGIPCPALIAGRPRSVMIGADVVTASAFRRRGVFRATAGALLESWRASGIALVLGLGNSSGASLAHSPDCEQPFRLDWRIRVLRPERLLARKMRIRPIGRMRRAGDLWNGWWSGRDEGSEISVQAVSAVGPELDAFWSEARRRVTNALVHDASWLRWRYEKRPENRGYTIILARRDDRPVGYAVHRVLARPTGTAVQIAELFAPGDRAAYRALIAAVIRDARAGDAELVSTLAVPGSEPDRELRHAGFVFRRRGWPVEITRLDRAIPKESLRASGSWLLSGGDFDVV